MSVQVDQPRDHVKPPRVNNVATFFGRDGDLDRRYLAVQNGNIRARVIAP
ncbi:MAG: hypothetical protein WD696_23010 [Bryobacteraceae bacterium]